MFYHHAIYKVSTICFSIHKDTGEFLPIHKIHFYFELVSSLLLSQSCPNARVLVHTNKLLLSVSLTGKSSRACAPLLSFLASAAQMVCRAFTSRFWSSSVSTRSLFHTRPLSNTYVHVCTSAWMYNTILYNFFDMLCRYITAMWPMDIVYWFVIQV